MKDSEKLRYIADEICGSGRSMPTIREDLRRIADSLDRQPPSDEEIYTRLDLEKAHIAGWNNIDFEDWFSEMTRQTE